MHHTITWPPVYQWLHIMILGWQDQKLCDETVYLVSLKIHHPSFAKPRQ